MKRAIIVHCWDGYPNYCWYPKTKKELEKLGFKVEVPEMPETELPKLSLWLPKLTKVAGKPGENLFLIGHSSGVITILRYLGGLRSNQKIGGAVLVAGFVDDLGYKELSNFFESPLGLKKIKKKAKHFVAIHSDNDPYVPLKHGNIFKKELGVKLIVKKSMGHFSGAGEGTDKECKSLPEVSREIKRMLNLNEVAVLPN